MRVVLVGSASLRQQLRLQLPDNVLVVGEAATLAAGRLDEDRLIFGQQIFSGKPGFIDVIGSHAGACCL